MAAITIATAPATTLPILRPLAPLSSPNKVLAQNSPTRALAFHKGKATVSPTSRIANTVSVLATAQRAPARSAQTIKCFFSIRSMKT